MRENQLNRRLEPTQMRQMRRVIDEIASNPVPYRVIARLIAHASAPDTTGFERYAGMALRAAAGPRFLQSDPGRVLRLTPSMTGQSVRLSCSADLKRQELSALVALESAINRLMCIGDAIENSSRLALAHDGRPLGISSMGVDYLPTVSNDRSAQVLLPPIGPTEHAQPDYFNEVDWRVLDSIASNAHAIFQNSMLPNMRQSIMGSYAPDGSDWDVRTRMAWILEQLDLPLGFSYRYDCDASSRITSVVFEAPVKAAFPHLVRSESAPALEETGDRLDDARRSYILKAMCLAAAACFGSGKRIEQAFVTAIDRDGGRVLASARFERTGFVHRALKAIDSGRFADPSLRFDPAAVAALAAPDELALLAESEQDSGTVPLDDGMSTQRIEPWKDARGLSAGMRQLFRSARICDIDTRHYYGSHAEIIDEAKRDAGESPVAAIARLEDIVAELEKDAMPPADEPDARPMHSENALARAMVTLLDDHFAVSDEALAFLNAPEDAPAAQSERQRFFRAPSALYHARMGLSDLYERLGDFRGAETQADRCIDLAPTSAHAHFRKADILAQQGRFAEASNIIMGALRCAVAERDCSLLYYHLALLMWNLGRKRESAAIYVYMTSLHGDYTEKALKTVAGLRARDDSPVIVYASPLAAAREMVRTRIPVAPSDAARMLVVRAAMGLSCMNAPRAAAPYAAALAHYLHDDRIVCSACRSLIHGASFDERSSAKPSR